MRILYIDVLCKSGSTGKIVYELYTRANGDGHEAAVAYGRGAEVREKNIFKFGLDWETRFHALFTRRLCRLFQIEFTAARNDKYIILRSRRTRDQRLEHLFRIPADLVGDRYRVDVSV